MNSDYKFKSAEELYNRVLPALRSKIDEFKKQNITYIKEKDIWLYLSKNYWRRKKDLEFYELIDSILNLSLNEINEYLVNNIKKESDDTIL